MNSRRHQGSEAVEQLERGQALRATATGACFICAYIERTIGLEDGAEAQCAMETGRGRRGKIVVRIA